MLSKTEYRILELLFNDLTKSYTILELSKSLKIPYAQAYKAVSTLSRKELIKCDKHGKAVFVTVELKELRKEYILIELIRRDNSLKKYPLIGHIIKDLQRVSKLQYICIVFGSYAKSLAKRDSDIDLLFIIPKDYDYGQFEKEVRDSLIISDKLDINIIIDESLHEMWSNPKKLNVANELLKGHLVLKGAEQFLEALEKHNVG